MMQQLNTSVLSAVNQNHLSRKKCIVEIKDQKQLVLPSSNTGCDSFTFDYVGGEEVSQEEIFSVVGKPIIDQCLHGYNGSIFAYGQTGSGKTYTIQGKDSYNESGDRNQRGLLPRCFEYLFQQICKIKNMHNQNSARNGKRSARQSGINGLPKFEDNVQQVEVDVKCSYLEIYNEVIIDLLDSSQQKVQIRETPERGIYPDPCIEEKVSSIQEVLEVIQKGARNRHIASTNMNNESSRSHAVFTATIKMSQILEDGEQIIKTSRFHIVDLAGSERSKDTGAEGQRLKEANSINKSLTTLGTVIYDLSENSENTTKGKSKHIRYRESKLTHLLKDALGGNSKTVMICNVNPHIEALKETRSTLMFAQRAKLIKNSAVVNEENFSAKYWKDKYNLLRAQTLPNPSHDINGNNQTLNNTMIGGNLGVCSHCQGSTKLKESKKLDEKTENELLIKAFENIKDLTLQLKEETSKRQESEIALDNMKRNFESFKNSINLRLKLREQSQKSATDKLLKFDAGNYSTNDHLEAMKDVIESLNQENDELKRQINNNPQLAAKNMYCIELEKRLNELMNELQYDKNCNQKVPLNTLLTTILEQLDHSITILNQGTYLKKEAVDPDRMEIDLDCRDSNLQKSYNNFYASQNDFSLMTQKRDQELANIKIQYEEQLEVIKNQLKSEQAKNQKLVNYFGQRNTQISSNTNNDIDLLSSQLGSCNVLLNTQNLLLTSQNTFTQNDQQMSSSTYVDNKEMYQTIEELVQFIEDIKVQINEKDQQIQIQEDELQVLKEQIGDLNFRLEQSMREKIETETSKIQMDDQIRMLTQQLAEVQLDNDNLYQQLQNVDELNEDCQKMRVQVQQLMDENMTLQMTNDYFSKNTIPELQKHQQMFEDQLNQMTNEMNSLKQQNKRLQEQRSKDQQVDQLQQQMNQLQDKYNQKEEIIKQIDCELKKTLEEVERMNNHIKYQQDLIEHDYKPEMQWQKDEINKLNSEMDNKIAQIKELEQILEKSEKLLHQSQEKSQALWRDAERLKARMVEQQGTYETTIKMLKSDRLQLESEKQILQEDLENVNRQLQRMQQNLTEESTKKEKYKEMVEQHMEQSQKAIEAIQRYRSSNMDKSQHLEEQLDKLKEENKELREIVRDRSNQILVQESKIKALEQQRDRMVKDDVTSKLRNLERENISLKGQCEYFQGQAVSIEGQKQIVESSLKELQKRYDDLDKNCIELANGGQDQKFQHMTKIKQENNKLTQQLLQLQADLKKQKQEYEKLQKKFNDNLQLFNDFGDKICQLMNINKNTIRVKCDQFYVKDYVNHVYDIITQGCTNQKLQLETPNALPSEQSMGVSSSSEPSNSESSDTRFNIFQTSRIEHFKLPTNKNTFQQPQQVNRHVNISLQAMNQSKVDNQENISFNMSTQQQQPSTNFTQQKVAQNLGFTVQTHLSTQKQAQFKQPQTQQQSNNKGLFQFGNSTTNKSIQGKSFMVNPLNGTQAKNNNGGQQQREPSNQRMDIDS